MIESKDSLAKKLWPVWVAVGLPLVLIALNSTPLAPDLFFVIIGIPALLVIWTCFGIWALVLTFRHMRRRDWSRAVITAVLPLAIIAAGTRLLDFIHLCNYGGDVVYFVVNRPSYLQQIRATPINGEPRLVVFNRGGMIWASRGYVYDESDEVLRRESLRSPNWKLRADGTELSCGYYAQAFPGHFSFTRHWYIASFNC